MIRTLALLMISGLLFTGCSSAERKEASSPAASPSVSKKAKVVDVRTPEEFDSGHIDGAINIPIADIESRIASVVPDKSTPLALHCRSGGRSARAKGILDRLGYTDVTDLGSLAHAREVLEAK